MIEKRKIPWVVVFACLSVAAVAIQALGWKVKRAEKPNRMMED